MPAARDGAGPAVESQALRIAEAHVRRLVVGEDGDDPWPPALDRRHPVRRVLALEDVERARCERQGLHPIVAAGQEPGDALVVRIGLAPEAAAVLERPARIRRLQEQRDRELGPVEVPVEPLARPVGHDVDAPQWIGHRVEPGLLHRRRQEVDERPPRVDPRDRAVRDLVAADRVVDGRVPAERRVPGLQALDVVVEVDVVIPGVSEGRGVDERLDLTGGGPQRLGPDQPIQAEHAGVAQRIPAAFDQRPAALAIERIHGPAIEVQNRSHDCTPRGSPPSPTASPPPADTTRAARGRPP